MKIIKTANGKINIKMSKNEWIELGKKTGWIKKSDFSEVIDQTKHIGKDVFDATKEIGGKTKNFVQRQFNEIFRSPQPFEILRKEIQKDIDGINKVYEWNMDHLLTVVPSYDKSVVERIKKTLNALQELKKSIPFITVKEYQNNQKEYDYLLNSKRQELKKLQTDIYNHRMNGSWYMSAQNF